MECVRTPEDRFKKLPNYPFSPNYYELESGMRMHYLDEGPRDGKVILMMHGEPSWSYLYRYMVPVCAAAGHRVLVPDLIGFGKSDKPVNMEDYTYARHVAWVSEWLASLKVKQVTLVCQDWGSMIGLRMVGENPDGFAAVVVGNGFLPTGEQTMPKMFTAWRAFARYSPWFPISRIIEAGTFKSLSKDERRAYDAPFPSERYKAGTRAFPRLVPTSRDAAGAQENRDAWATLAKWNKPFVTAFSNGDPIMRGGDIYMQERIPGCKDQPHVTLKGGHFLQEDAGFEFATLVNQVVDRL